VAKPSAALLRSGDGAPGDITHLINEGEEQTMRAHQLNKTLPPSSKRTLGKEVADRLRQDIMAGRLPAGALLRENTVAEDMGVSRGPVREALSRLGATNAVSLVIDDTVLFQDKDQRPDDLGDLFLAFHEHADVFGKEFRMLRLAVEHDEAGIHYVLEVVARTEHPEQEAAARLVIGGRVKDFEPKPGEDAQAYRERVEPLTRNPGLFEVHRRPTRRVKFRRSLGRSTWAICCPSGWTSARRGRSRGRRHREPGSAA
jgi:hypothetical protein